MSDNKTTKKHTSSTVSDRSWFYIARVVVETMTPLSIGAGIPDGVHDNLLVRDANGLPALPGSSIAGVLRQLYCTSYGNTATERLFGIGKQRQEQVEDSPSLVQVSWGCIHNSNDKPIQGLLDPKDESWRKDVTLQDALQTIPVKRDHVKLTAKGVASTQNMAKFDRVSLTAGHRFSVELSLWSDQANDPRWQHLMALLARDDFRLGGRTRAGLGALKVVRCHDRQFDLYDNNDFSDFQNLGHDLAQTDCLSKNIAESLVFNQHRSEQIQIKLTPEKGGAGYRFGAGVNPIHPDSDADLVSVTERRIGWTHANTSNTDIATLKERELVIPASAIKGALRHRTAYYYNLLSGQTIDWQQAAHNKDDVMHSDAQEVSIDNNQAVEQLFGYSRKEEEDGKMVTVTRVGKVIINDIYLPLPNHQGTTTLAHNSIDRFTGGVREHMLFFEEVITQKNPLSFSLLLPDKQSITDQYIIEALEKAVIDLCKGRLALGAGSGRIGSGYFSGEWVWKTPQKDNQDQGVAA